MNTYPLNLLTTLFAQLSAGVPADVDKPAILPPGYTLADTEQYRSSPERWRHTFKTSSLQAFLQYADDHTIPGTTLTIDPERLIATAIFDHGFTGDPGWGDHRAILELEPTPIYKAALTICPGGQPITQEALIDWLIDWQPHLDLSAASPEVDWQPIPFTTAIAALRRIQVKTGTDQTRDVSDVSVSKSLLASAAITSDPPRAIRIVAPLYEELGTRTLILRLVYLPKDPPLIRARIQHQVELQRDCANELIERITNHGLDIPQYIGTIYKH